MTTLIQIAERRVADITILELTGRMLLEEGDIPLRDYIDELARQGRVKIVLDMQGVALDSAGIGMHVAKYLTVHRRGGTVKLLNLTERASYLLRIMKLDGVFEIFDSEDAAVRSFVNP
ncbi:MAG: STAS domain-containing protein [Vicinamibacterales bacterium]